MPPQTRAPMTSVFMVLEVSGNYSLILPVMISNTLAYLISRQYQSVSLFDMLARQDEAPVHGLAARAGWNGCDQGFHR